MTQLEDAATFAQDPAARGPIKVAIITAAISIVNEAPTTPNHLARVGLAYEVVQDSNAMASRFAWAIATNPTVTGKWAAADYDGAFGDIPFVIGTVWDAVAGPPILAPEPDPEIPPTQL